jgi:hypothetical protein
MTLVEQSLRDLLIQANVVGSRVFLARAPQKPAAAMTTPYIVFFHIAPNPHYSHDGPINTMDRDYQVGIFDPSQSLALGMADTLRSYLEGFRGDFEQAHFYAFFHRTQTQAYEFDTQLFHIVQEYRILYALLNGTRNPAVRTAVPNRSKRSNA